MSNMSVIVQNNLQMRFYFQPTLEGRQIWDVTTRDTLCPVLIIMAVRNPVSDGAECLWFRIGPRATSDLHCHTIRLVSGIWNCTCTKLFEGNRQHCCLELVVWSSQYGATNSSSQHVGCKTDTLGKSSVSIWYPFMQYDDRIIINYSNYAHNYNWSMRDKYWINTCQYNANNSRTIISVKFLACSRKQ